MKKIFMRLINLLTVLAVIIFGVWIYNVIDVLVSGTERYLSYDGFYIAMAILCITLAANYVFFGRLTLWNRMQSED